MRDRSTFITTKTYHKVIKNGNVIDKKMLDASYDGNKAVIDTYDNNKAFRFELTKKDTLLNTTQNSTWELDPKTIEIWNQHAICINQIFQSCHITWMELNWPDIDENLKFGLDKKIPNLEYLQGPYSES